MTGVQVRLCSRRITGQYYGVRISTPLFRGAGWATRQRLKMSWELVRDMGLIIFVFGGLVRLLMSTIFHQRMGITNAAWMNTIADRMMLVGACLAVIAMLVGYLMSGESP